MNSTIKVINHEGFVRDLKAAGINVFAIPTK